MSFFVLVLIVSVPVLSGGIQLVMLPVSVEVMQH